MRVLLLSAYDARSHRYWREGVVAHLPEFDFEVHTLPARFFSWRFRGNSLTWADADFGEHDVILATSMTDLSALRGLNRRVAATPAVLYFHENQFAYPSDEPAAHLVDRQVTSIYGALAAERIAFNSDYNRHTFLDGARALLKRLPDGVPKGTVDRLAARSTVLPVPLGEECFAGAKRRGTDTFDIVWNHRWEVDKGPARLLAVVAALLGRGTPFRMHLLGGDVTRPHPEIERAAALLRERGCLGHYGQLPQRDDYLECLRTSHVVLSTTLHEFQGLAVQEAMALGCIPVVPNRLAYPGYVPEALRYAGSDDVALEASAAADLIDRVARGVDVQCDLMKDVAWPVMAQRYRDLLVDAVSARGSSQPNSL